jgi:anti-sigma regulatory factor (Ser/Thr protein kinase)/c-di-GMP-binding flagellar brake protein YcgR
MQPSNAAPAVPAQVHSEHTHLVVPGLPHWIEPTVEHLRQRAIQCGACQESRAGKLMVALLEAMSNAVIHGNLELGSELKERGDDSFARALAEHASDPRLAERSVDIQVAYDGETCHWIITDEGQGFDVARILERCLSDDPEVLLASGRGILMMTSFLDGIRYELGGRQVILTLKRHSGEEKRRHPRVPLNLAFRVAPVQADGTPDWAAANDAVSRDFSRGGVTLLQEGLAQGQRIVIGITASGKLVPIPAVVRHCRTIGAGSIELGCEFEITPGEASPAETATTEQLQEVHQAILDVLALHQGPEIPEHDRRQHTRVAFNKAVTVDAAAPSGPLTGYTRDLSKGGMSIIARAPVPLSVALIVLPREGANPLRVRSHVVRCNRIQEGFYDIGVQFLRLEKNAGM